VTFLLTAFPVLLAAFAGCRSEPKPYPEPRAVTTAEGGPGFWGFPGDATCAFPKEADQHKVDAAVVTLRVRVGPDGSPLAVQTLEEPGFGFGAAATRCAMARRYTPARDTNGTPFAEWTPPFNLKFVR
jgi:hypothetical protein